MPSPGERIDVLGVGVDPLGWPEVLAQVAAWITAPADRPRLITYANVHVVNQALQHPDLRATLADSDLCYCDGNGIILGARLLGEPPPPARMTGAAWIWDLAAAAEARGWRIHWIGGAPGVTDDAAARLRAKHPALQITTDHGFHPPDSPAHTASLDRLNAARPDIVLVGMGTPLQERWAAANRDRISAPVLWCLGATADFISGQVPRVGPPWLIARHEWLSRLLADPRRLWQRYLIGNTTFLARSAAHGVRRRLRAAT